MRRIKLKCNECKHEWYEHHSSEYNDKVYCPNCYKLHHTHKFVRKRLEHKKLITAPRVRANKINPFEGKKMKQKDLFGKKRWSIRT